MLSAVNIREYMLPQPVTVHPEAGILEAVRLITDNRISGLCVVDDRQNLVGILSELDCLRAVLQATCNNSSAGQVQDYMATDNLVVTHPDEDVMDVARDMLSKNKRRRPVIEEGRLIGQITCRQLLRAVRDYKP